MKTIVLTDEQFQFLGSLLGHCFCGSHPELMPTYNAFSRLEPGKSFPEPVINYGESRPGCLYVEVPKIGRVISYNIPQGRNDARCLEEIKQIVQKYNGDIIDD